jgi:hypothetical protein
VIRNWLWWFTLATWFAVCVVLLLALLLFASGAKTATVAVVSAMAIPVAMAATIGPTAEMYLRSLGAGTLFGPDPGTVFGLPRLERACISAIAEREERKFRRLGHSAPMRGCGHSTTNVRGSLWLRDMYGDQFMAGNGLLIAKQHRLVFVASTWFGRRSIILGSTPDEESMRGRLHELIAIEGRGPFQLRIARWQPLTSLPGGEAWFKPSGPGALLFIDQLSTTR